MLFKYTDSGGDKAYRKPNTIFILKNMILKASFFWICGNNRCCLDHSKKIMKSFGNCCSDDMRSIRGECCGTTRPDKIYVGFMLIRKIGK